MRTVSLQGVQLSKGQQQRLAFERHVRQFMHPVLEQQVTETIKQLDVRKEQGAKPERVWFPDYQSYGTPSVAEWMGYEFNEAQLGQFETL